MGSLAGSGDGNVFAAADRGGSPVAPERMQARTPHTRAKKITIKMRNAQSMHISAISVEVSIWFRLETSVRASIALAVKHNPAADKKERVWKPRVIYANTITQKTGSLIHCSCHASHVQS